jgi:hypothetical protein
MDQIGVKTEKLWLKQVEWQNCKYPKMYLFLTETKYAFQ